jgi:hypothetical protein
LSEVEIAVLIRAAQAQTCRASASPQARH